MADIRFPPVLTALQKGRVSSETKKCTIMCLDTGGLMPVNPTLKKIKKLNLTHYLNITTSAYL